MEREPPRLRVGTRVGEYILGRCVAVGATSEVYAGQHATGGTSVAVKVLHPSWCLHPEVVTRFLNEARTLEALRHPHLVGFRGAGVLAEGRPFMVLDWHPEDLQRALRREGGRLPARDCTQVVRQLAEVLTLLHEHGLIHRDLKPANVLVVRHKPGAWSIRLADLGLAKRLPAEGDLDPGLPVSTASNAVLGTAEYMAPEQGLDPKRVTSRADVYSLGVVWFELLSGHPPFTGSQGSLRFQHVTQPPPLKLLAEVASAEVQSLLARMLEKSASDRPSMKELLSAIPPS